MSLLQRTVKRNLTDLLRQEILRGTLAPGEHLRQDEVAVRFAVSTMPVREAFHSLEAEGLVTIYPHRGAVVSSLSAQDLEDLYDIRATLEEMAAGLAVPHLSEERLSELDACLQDLDRHLSGGDAAILVDLNHQFHTTLYAASGRRQLCDLVQTLRRRTQHYLHAYTDLVGSMPAAQAEHREILAACRRGDAETASALTRAHVLRVGAVLVQHTRQKEDIDHN